MTANYFDKFFELLQELINNKFCYIVNVYLPFEDRVIRWRKETNKNHIERNFVVDNFYSWFEPESKMEKLLEQCYDDTVLLGKDYFTMKQTFVYIHDHYKHRTGLLQKLERFHELSNWQVILSISIFDLDTVPWRLKIPIHNIYLKGTETFMDLSLKNFMDVIKRPGYDRYKFYRSIPFHDNSFNHSCLRGIKKIHIALAKLDDLYLPMALAILDKENQHRQENRSLGPMEIIFYTVSTKSPKSAKYLAKNLKFFTAFNNLHELSDRNENVYIAVIDDVSLMKCLFVDHFEADFFTVIHQSCSMDAIGLGI